MTDKWQKAREAAIGDALKAGGWANDDETFKIMAGYLDAALSAFETAGWELVPREPSKAVRGAAETELAGMSIAEPPTNGCGNCLINGWNAMITAALKERQT